MKTVVVLTIQVVVKPTTSMVQSTSQDSIEQDLNERQKARTYRNWPSVEVRSKTKTQDATYNCITFNL